MWEDASKYPESNDDVIYIQDDSTRTIEAPTVIQEILMPTTWRQSASGDFAPAAHVEDAFIVAQLWSNGKMTWRPLETE
jgi:hypothetical protein